MVVTDSHLFTSPNATMKVRLCSMEGGELVMEVRGDWTADKVKQCAGSLYQSPLGVGADVMKASLGYRLLLMRTNEGLREEQTLAAQGVLDGDEILLLPKRSKIPVMEGTERQREDRKPPDMAAIRRFTANLPKKNQDVLEEDNGTGLDFQSELRKILISLIEASQKILCLNPEAAKIFKQAEDLLLESSTRKTSGPDESSVRQLTDMGFAEAHARKALMLNQESVVSAMEWLLNHQADPDIDSPLPGQQNDSDQPSSETEGAVGGLTEAGDGPGFRNILDSIRSFQRREFRPNPRALQHLIDMGFPEKDAIEALRFSRNNQDAACEWLLGDRPLAPVQGESGLAPGSPVLTAILAAPQVQLGLNSPRCLLAFLQMLESPISASHWLTDPETGPLLMAVSRIYHSEKHTQLS